MMTTRRTRLIAASLVAVTTVALYLPALGNGFVVWDDDIFIVNNKHIRSLNRDFLTWALTDMSLDFWRPLVWFSHAVDYAFWGLVPAGHHLTSILLHGVNTFLIIILLIRILKISSCNRYSEGPSEIPSLLSERDILITATITGLLFGIHPLHVESVAWVTTRTDLLYTLFYLLSIVSYIPFAEQAGARRAQGGLFPPLTRYLLSLVLFVLSAASKPMAVTLPLVLLVLDWQPLGRLSSLRNLPRLVLEKLPFFAVSIAVSAVAVVGESALKSITPLDAVPLSLRLSVAVQSVLSYLGKLALPVHLMPFYPFPDSLSPLSPGNAAAVLLVVGITVVFVIIARKRPVWLAVWAFYLISLLPVLGLVKARGVAMADRYTYLSTVGVFILLGLGAAKLWRMAELSVRRGRMFRISLLSAAGTVIIILCVMTQKQIDLWKDSVRLWSSVIEREPNRVPLAYNNRGVAFREMGMRDRALEDYTTAITLDPFDAKYYMNRGIIYGETGQLDKAMKDLNKAIDLNPASADAYTSRGLVLATTGRHDQALSDYEKAIALAPSSVDAYYNRGMLRERRGRNDEAIKDYSRAISLDPADHQALLRRGMVFSSRGDIKKAHDDYTAAVSVKPGFALAYRERGLLYLRTGAQELAESDLRKACALGDVAACGLKDVRGQTLSGETAGTP